MIIIIKFEIPSAINFKESQIKRWKFFKRFNISEYGNFLIINARKLRNKKLKFIDLSADFRIINPKIYKKHYNISHKAIKLIKYSLYSVPELNKGTINKYRIIANPGCYPTSIQIPLIPLIKNNLINDKEIIIDSKSGYSGAGKNLEKKFTHKNLYSSIFAYNTKNHKHTCLFVLGVIFWEGNKMVIGLMPMAKIRYGNQSVCNFNFQPKYL